MNEKKKKFKQEEEEEERKKRKEEFSTKMTMIIPEQHSSLSLSLQR